MKVTCSLEKYVLTVLEYVEDNMHLPEKNEILRLWIIDISNFRDKMCKIKYISLSYHHYIELS